PAKRMLFHGTLNASKSAQIIMQAYNLERQGKKILVFKPAADVRDGSLVKSRAPEEKREAVVMRKYDNGLMNAVATEAKPDAIFVDELQFFTKEQVEEMAQISIDLNVPVFAYGLLISYTGELFEGSKRAIECGFALHEIEMQCDFCSDKSTHHLLYING